MMFLQKNLKFFKKFSCYFNIFIFKTFAEIQNIFVKKKKYKKFGKTSSNGKFSFYENFKKLL